MRTRPINGRHNSKVAAFPHIEKTGGTTVEALLKRHFGLRHLNVDSREGPDTYYTPADMAEDFRFYPFVRSIAAHRLRPFLDYGKLERRLMWYVWLRDPVDRYVSHCQHQIEKMGVRADFPAWLRMAKYRNFQVRKLAGKEDLEAAKQILATKMSCIGLLERFDESLLLLRHRMQWPGLTVAYGKPRNPARTRGVRERITDQLDKHFDDARAANALDQALYDYAVGVLYPRLREDYGESRLRHDLGTEFAQPRRRLRAEIREFESRAFGRLVYKPFLKASKLLRRVRNSPGRSGSR